MAALVAAIGGLALHLATAIAHRRKHDAIKENSAIDPFPEQGVFIPYREYAPIADQARVTSFRKGRDTRGAPCFFVHYEGHNGTVIQYHHPANNQI